MRLSIMLSWRELILIRIQAINTIDSYCTETYRIQPPIKQPTRISKTV
jgi:hypothetical protein